jgi:hypothetical protein
MLLLDIVSGREEHELTTEYSIASAFHSPWESPPPDRRQMLTAVYTNRRLERQTSLQARYAIDLRRVPIGVAAY